MPLPPSSSFSAARVLHVDRVMHVGSVANVSAVVWLDTPTSDHVVRMNQHYATMRLEHPAGFAVLTVVENAAGLPDEKTRQEMNQLLDKLGGSATCMAAVQEAEGFRGAALRSVMTAIDLVSRAPYPRKMFATVELAAPWLAENSAPRGRRPSVTAAQIIEAIQQIRRATSV